jgi:EAL and modified HD-GYP domain-containing signal transduction protein
MSQFFVGRQPLLDRRMTTIGYELLFRSRQEATDAVFADGDAATASVLLNAVTEIGLDNLVGEPSACSPCSTR